MNKKKRLNKISLSNFELIRELGQGTFSCVYLVREKYTGKFFAMKAISKQRLLNSQSLNNFFMEKVCLKYLQHPRIVKSYATFQNLTDIFFIMEYIAGGNFEDFIHKSSLTESEIKKYAYQILLILEYIHSKGIMHRDIKFGNFVLDEFQNLKLIDLGSARVYKKTTETTVLLKEVEKSKKQIKSFIPRGFRNKSLAKFTLSSLELKDNSQLSYQQILSSDSHSQTSIVQSKGGVFGTPLFISPEAESGEVDNMTDIWSLGVCIYYLHTKTYPFEGTELEILEKVSCEEPNFDIIVF